MAIGSLALKACYSTAVSLAIAILTTWRSMIVKHTSSQNFKFGEMMVLQRLGLTLNLSTWTKVVLAQAAWTPSSMLAMANPTTVALA